MIESIILSKDNNKWQLNIISHNFTLINSLVIDFSEEPNGRVEILFEVMNKNPKYALERKTYTGTLGIQPSQLLSLNYVWTRQYFNLAQEDNEYGNEVISIEMKPTQNNIARYLSELSN